MSSLAINNYSQVDSKHVLRISPYEGHYSYNVVRLSCIDGSLSHCIYKLTQIICLKWVRVMVFNATFNNISVISWLSVLLVEETGVPGENQRPATSHWQTLSHNVISSTPRMSGTRTHNVSDERHWLHR